jgi:hypothetical protein
MLIVGTAHTKLSISLERRIIMIILQNKKNIETRKGKGMVEYFDQGNGGKDRLYEGFVKRSIILFGDDVKLVVEILVENDFHCDCKGSWNSAFDTDEKHIYFNIKGFPPINVEVTYGHAVSTYGVDNWGDHMMFEECVKALENNSITELSFDTHFAKRKGVDVDEFHASVQEHAPEMLKLLKKFQKVTGIKTNDDLDQAVEDLRIFAKENYSK